MRNPYAIANDLFRLELRDKDVRWSRELLARPPTWLIVDVRYFRFSESPWDKHDYGEFWIGDELYWFRIRGDQRKTLTIGRAYSPIRYTLFQKAFNVVFDFVHAHTSVLTDLRRRYPQDWS